MHIRYNDQNYQGNDITLSGGFQLAVCPASESSHVLTEMHHGTIEGDALRDKWYIAITEHDFYIDMPRIVSRSKAFESKEAALEALTGDGVKVGFDTGAWLGCKKDSTMEVIKIFGGPA